MKKRIFVIAMAVALSSGYLTVKSFSPEVAMTPAQIANLEALAGGPPGQGGDGGGSVPCFSSAEVNRNKAYVDCASCERYQGWEGYGRESNCGGDN